MTCVRCWSQRCLLLVYAYFARWSFQNRHAQGVHSLLCPSACACMLAGHHGVSEGQACQLVGGSQDVAALLHNYGAGACVWDMVFCSCMGLRPVAATVALVCIHIKCRTKEAAVSSAPGELGTCQDCESAAESSPLPKEGCVTASPCHTVCAKLYIRQ